MKAQTQLLQCLQERAAYLEKLIVEKKKSLKNAPDGNLRIRRRGDHDYYYLRKRPNDVNGQYMKKKEVDLASKIAQKCYDEKILKYAEIELSEIEKYLKYCETEIIEDVYESLPEGRRNLIKPIRPTDDEYVQMWNNKEYERKGFSENSPEYFTAKGERVRSKSELIIADTLNRMGIPYHYEFPITLKKIGTIHPDFMVLNVRLRKTYLWEHLGMMDQKEYCEKALERIELYEENHILPGDKLIITHETSLQPLKTKHLEEIIKYYLL